MEAGGLGAELFVSKRCIHCKGSWAELEKAVEELKREGIVLSTRLVDVDQDTPFAASRQVQYLPTLLLTRNSNVLRAMTGLCRSAKIVTEVKEVVE